MKVYGQRGYKEQEVRRLKSALTNAFEAPTEDNMVDLLITAANTIKQGGVIYPDDLYRICKDVADYIESLEEPAARY